MSTSVPLTYSLEADVALVTMDDGKANAMSADMLAHLDEAIDRAVKESKAVVLSGRPGRFCAGFDLKVMMSGPDAAKDLLRRGARVLMKLYGLPIPLVIACTGHAVAGGALMLLTGDFRIAARGAFRIGLNEVAIGMPVPILAMDLVRDRIARQHQGNATLLAQTYEPDEALAVGYVDRVASPEEVLSLAKEEARRFGGFSSFAFRATKARLRDATIERILSTLETDMSDLLRPLA